MSIKPEAQGLLSTSQMRRKQELPLAPSSLQVELISLLLQLLL